MRRPLPSIRPTLFYFLHDKLIAPVQLRLRRHAGERAMLALEDRLLDDIGLSRADIHAAAYGLLTPEFTNRTRTCGEVGAALRRAVAAAALLLACVPSPASADNGEFDSLPTTADLPPGTVKVSPPIRGMGEHWANPRDLPLGPIYCVMNGRVICAEFMIAQRDFVNGKSFERLRLGLRGKLPPVDHLEVTFAPHGHEGFEEPHYDLHMYFIAPEARFAGPMARR